MRKKKTSLNFGLMVMFLLVIAFGALCNTQTVEAKTTKNATYTDKQGVVYTLENNTCYVSGHTDSIKGNITLPKTITQNGKVYKLTKIGKNAFNGCYDITGVVIPNSVKTIDDWAFTWCALESVKIPSSVTLLGDCVFRYCDNLKKVEIDGKITKIGMYTFALTKLESIKLPDSVTSIDEWAFWGTNLSEMKIPKNVKKIGEYAFADCGSLKSVTISNKVKTIGAGAFRACDKITKITIPDSVKKIGDFAFEGCGFTTVTIPKSVTSIGNAVFKDCNKLTNLKVAKGNTKYCSDKQGCIYSKSKTVLIESLPTAQKVVIPDSVKQIKAYAFSNCKKLTEIVIPEQVSKIEASAFCDCTKLKNITIKSQKLNEKNVGEEAFYNTYKKVTISVPSDKLDEYGELLKSRGVSKKGEIVEK